jgi:para-nitrobenzyl esterase
MGAEPIGVTAAGRVRGAWEGDTAVFLGIPYAAPPFGEDRFRPPRPPAPWDGTRDALADGASAPQPERQFTLIPEPVIPGNDCLNLNVFTSDLGDARLPVLVWIHGGGFVAGCNASPWYRGHRFVRDGVVVVAVNYRLGIEGFLPIADAPANRGVLDWLAALRWVQDNVARFGGDPGRVTVAGQSAGGVAAATLLATPAARGLFGRAILMSGAGQGLTSVDGGVRQARAIGSIVGAATTRDGLAAVPMDRLLAAQDDYELRRSRERLPPLIGPVVDGETVTSTVLDAVRSGGTNDIELVVGATAEEAHALASGAGGALDDAALRKRLARLGMAEERIEAFVAAHPGASAVELLGQGATDSIFRAPAAHMAEERAGAGAPVQAYELTWRSTIEGLGAVHCLDVPFVFDVLDAGGVEEVTGPAPPQAMADAMHAAWVGFVRDGDAGWARYEHETRSVMVFDEPAELRSDVWQLPRTAWPLGEPEHAATPPGRRAGN